MLLVSGFLGTFWCWVLVRWFWVTGLGLVVGLVRIGLVGLVSGLMFVVPVGVGFAGSGGGGFWELGWVVVFACLENLSMSWSIGLVFGFPRFGRGFSVLLCLVLSSSSGFIRFWLAAACLASSSFRFNLEAILDSSSFVPSLAGSKPPPTSPN